MVAVDVVDVQPLARRRRLPLSTVMTRSHPSSAGSLARRDAMQLSLEFTLEAKRHKPFFVRRVYDKVGFRGGRHRWGYSLCALVRSYPSLARAGCSYRWRRRSRDMGSLIDVTKLDHSTLHELLVHERNICTRNESNTVKEARARKGGHIRICVPSPCQ